MRLPASVLFVALLAAVPGRGEQAPTPFELPRFNRTYVDPVEQIDPWQQGAITVHLSSPSHRFTLHSHRVWLRPSSRGTLLASLDLEFEGSGGVIADLEMGRLTQRIEDRVVVPRQERSIRGEIRIERVATGYRVTTYRLPSVFRVRIQSGFTGRLVGICEQMAILPLVNLDCDGFRDTLSVIDAELPPPGQSYLLPDTELSDRDRTHLDRFLANLAAPSTSPEPDLLNPSP